MGEAGMISLEYSYGFNGQEKDDEIAGEGNSYTAEFWQYDSRLGRRWNIDPVVKYHESPYACFANNPIWFADPNGADSINVTSGSLDSKGRDEDHKDFDKSNMLLLFQAYVDNGKSGTRTMPLSDFNGQYQTVGKYIEFKVDGINVAKEFATVLCANYDDPSFSKAVPTITLAQINEAKNNGIRMWEDSYNPNSDVFKFDNWSGGEDLDTKADGKLMDGYPIIFVPGVGQGIFRSDFIGNVIYGSAWAKYQPINRTLYDGDYAQKMFAYKSKWLRGGIDDPEDGYAILLGHWTAGKNITAATLLNVGIHFQKSTLRKTTYGNINKYTVKKHFQCINTTN